MISVHAKQAVREMKVHCHIDYTQSNPHGSAKQQHRLKNNRSRKWE
ncbi:hypothetical protein [Shouchella clausii]|nr:hypothetical protein [Shouchella clausii]MDO7267705.1 hypothetical protein [Shouchella clausii]MDO7287341.1 hypothetical protein [Shouchella clausii]